MSNLKRIVVSVPSALLAEVDGVALSQHSNRSQLVREALQAYVERKKRLELMEQMVRGYLEMADINLEIAEQWWSPGIAHKPQPGGEGA
ncbi:MAG: CopG family ribbon-helix-helix protein [Bacillota bacterium]